MWFITKNAILTWKNLHKRRWVGPDICILCIGNTENVTYMMLKCSFSVLIWSKRALLFRPEKNMSECFNVWSRVRDHKGQRGIARLVVSTVCSNI